jgi:hypothetical protein
LEDPVAAPQPPTIPPALHRYAAETGRTYTRVQTFYLQRMEAIERTRRTRVDAPVESPDRLPDADRRRAVLARLHTRAQQDCRDADCGVEMRLLCDPEYAPTRALGGPRAPQG